MTPEELAAANAALTIGSLGAPSLVIVQRSDQRCGVCGVALEHGGEAARWYAGLAHVACVREGEHAMKGGT